LNIRSLKDYSFEEGPKDIKVPPDYVGLSRVLKTLQPIGFIILSLIKNNKGKA